MPTELSEDIWREVIAFSPKDTRDVVPQYIHNLSLTNRRLRQIALPTLYRSLTFSISNYHTEFDPTHMHKTMVNLIKLYTRAKALYNSPHLLRLVRELTLERWSTSSPLVDGAYWGLVRMVSQDMVDAVPKMAVAMCDSLSGLVSRIPDLRDLSMTTRMTPDLYRRICSSTPLISLRVHVTNLPVTDVQEVISRTPADHQKMSHIRHLRYLIIRDNFAAERYFVHILEDCLLKLETLEIQSTQLMLVNSLISNGPISLQSLRVSFHYGQPVHDSILWDLLRACPKLRFLTIVGAMPEISPLDPGVHVLPSLAEITSVPSHVRALTMGKQMEVIEITRAFHLSEYSLTDIVRCSTTHLHTLNITVTLETLQDFLQFLHSLCQFKNLVNFRASYHGPITPGSGSLSLQVSFHADFQRQAIIKIHLHTGPT